MRHPNSESLAKAAEAARRREEETAKLADARSRVRDAQGIVRAAEGEVRVAEVREDVAAREVGLHLSGAIPPAGSEASDTAYREQPRQTTSWFRGGRPPPPGAADAALSEPDRRRWNVPNNLATWALALAIIALIVAVVALFLPKGDIVALGDVRREIRTALQPVAKKADDAKATADKVDELNVAQFKSIKDLAQKQEAFEKSTKEALDKKCDCPKGKPAPAKEPKKSAAKPAKPVAAAPVAPKAEAKVSKKVDGCVKDCEPKIIAKDHGEKVSPSGQCGIQVVKSDGQTLIAKLVVKEHSGRIQLTRVHEFMTDEDMRIYQQKTGERLSPKLFPWTAKGVCDADQAIVKTNWSRVVGEFKFPHDCTPVLKRS